MRAAPRTVARRLARRGRGTRGAALVIVLWLLVLLTTLAGSHAYNAHVETRLAGNRLELARARHAAEAGVYRGILELFRPPLRGRWVADGSAHAMAVDDTAVTVSLTNAAGLVDLNQAPPELLRVLMGVLTDDPTEQDSLVDAVLDWRDPDDLVRAHGAERRDYQALARVGPRNGPFATPIELRYVLGLSALAVERLRPLVTVWSGFAGINPRFAPPELLAAMPGADEERVGSYVEGRGASRLAGAPMVGGVQGLLTDVESQACVVAAVATRPNGTRARVTAVVNLRARASAGARGRYIVNEWRES
jgi:general secretion pathway protein K